MVGIGPHGNRRRLVGPVMNEIYYVATDIDLVSTNVLNVAGTGIDMASGHRNDRAKQKEN
jgi:hypothetical protein